MPTSISEDEFTDFTFPEILQSLVDERGLHLNPSVCRSYEDLEGDKEEIAEIIVNWCRETNGDPTNILKKGAALLSYLDLVDSSKNEEYQEYLKSGLGVIRDPGITEKILDSTVKLMDSGCENVLEVVYGKLGTIRYVEVLSDLVELDQMEMIKEFDGKITGKRTAKKLVKSLSAYKHILENSITYESMLDVLDGMGVDGCRIGNRFGNVLQFLENDGPRPRLEQPGWMEEYGLRRVGLQLEQPYCMEEHGFEGVKPKKRRSTEVDEVRDYLSRKIGEFKDYLRREPKDSNMRVLGRWIVKQVGREVRKVLKKNFGSSDIDVDRLMEFKSYARHFKQYPELVDVLLTDAQVSVEKTAPDFEYNLRDERGAYTVLFKPRELKRQFKALDKVSSCFSPGGSHFDNALNIVKENPDTFVAVIEKDGEIVGRVNLIVNGKGELAVLSRVYGEGGTLLESAIKEYESEFGLKEVSAEEIEFADPDVYDDFRQIGVTGGWGLQVNQEFLGRLPGDVDGWYQGNIEQLYGRIDNYLTRVGDHLLDLDLGSGYSADNLGEFLPDARGIVQSQEEGDFRDEEVRVDGEESGVQDYLHTINRGITSWFFNRETGELEENEVSGGFSLQTSWA